MTLTERSGQVDQLVRRLAELSHPDGHHPGDKPVVALTGPVGAGKTALLQTFARHVTDSGARFLGASASRAERDVPFEVVRQLVRAAALTPDLLAGADQLLDNGALAWGDEDDGRHRDESARITGALGGLLLDLAAQTPLVIAVDDVHHADVPSLRCLDYVARRAATAHLLIVLTEAPRTTVRHPEVYAELLQPARLHRIRVPPLSADGTYTVLAARLGAVVARDIVAECHRISGGSPLLVHALADDQLTAPPGHEERAVVGEAFREAVLSCLYRCEHLVLKTARALAVAGEPIGDILLPELADVPSESSLRAIDAHTGAGLIVHGRLRHRTVGQAVLDGMTAEERTRLHRRAACLLHRHGAPVTTVAGHLMKTGELDEPWMTQSLVEAGEQALHEGEVHTALRYLRRANRYCPDECARARIRSALAHAEWRLDPQAAIAHLPGLATAVRAGHLDGPQVARPIQYLLWHGLVDEAVDLVHHLHDHADGADPAYATELFVTQGWLSTLYPGVRADRPAPAVPSRDPLTLSRIKKRLQGVTMLVAVLERGDLSAVEHAEQALSTSGMDDEKTCWTAVCALVALIYADRLDQASGWCTRLAENSATHRQPTPSALIGVLQAVIAGRRGDLPAAQGLADTALSQLSAKGWGVGIGVPLATRLRALTFMNELDEAAACLQVPVPAALFETPFGLHYLHARGLYSLAAGSPENALADFQLCGQLMTRWRLDLPALVPWRTGAARALLRRGRSRQAERLVREELSRLRPAHLRHRGAALRVLAATDDTPGRLQLLRTSVRLLEQAGDRMELAHSLTDLGHAYQQLGDQVKARSTGRAARALAEECGIPLLRPGPTAGRPNGGRSGAQILVDGLSDAETRVAMLAAQGHTNREIAEQLFLTVSTIEQRLTRIYRKLDVNSRSELVSRLRLSHPGALTVGHTVDSAPRSSRLAGGGQMSRPPSRRVPGAR